MDNNRRVIEPRTVAEQLLYSTVQICGDGGIGVIDIACFPGSSGSPVLICMRGFHDKTGTYHIVASKNILLGLLFGGPYLSQSGKVEIKEIPTVNIIPIATFNQMIHLGYYVKAKEILILCEQIKKMFSDRNTDDSIESKAL